MRFLVKVTIPVEAGNQLVSDPQFGEQLRSILSGIKPETAYFAIEGGQRTIYLIVNVKDASQTPAIAEPFWLSMQASVAFTPIMTQADMDRAMPAIMQAAKKYGGGASSSPRRARVLASS